VRRGADVSGEEGPVSDVRSRFICRIFLARLAMSVFSRVLPQGLMIDL